MCSNAYIMPIFPVLTIIYTYQERKQRNGYIELHSTVSTLHERNPVVAKHLLLLLLLSDIDYLLKATSQPFK